MNSNIFKELKNRKVLKSVGIYAAFAFVSIQVCSIVFPALHLPEWTITFVVVLCIMGFPATFILSWIYDITPEGVIKTEKDKIKANNNYNVIILILVIAGTVLFYYNNELFKPKVNPKSVAVLPFDNYSPRSEDEFLSAGFTEVIIANLAKVKDLMVISRTSVMRYENTDMSWQEIAEELNVANILEGSIQRKGNKIRVVGQLIEAKTNNHLWAETYDKEIDDIFAIQTSIAKEIASALKSQITESEKLVIEDKLTDNTEAYEIYLKVKELRSDIFSEVLSKRQLRINLLQKLIDIDPEFAEAYALLSIEYSEKVHFGTENIQNQIDAATQYVEKAFSLKPDSHEVRFAYGYYYYGCYKDYPKALKHYKYALTKEPGNSDYNAYIGFANRRLGNENETIKYLEKAFRLDPNSFLLVNELLGTYLFFKRYEKIDLVENYKQLYKHTPNDGNLYSGSAKVTFWLEGHTTNARKIIKGSSKLTPNFDYYEDVLWKLDIYDENYENYLDYVSNKKDSIEFGFFYIMPKYAEVGFAYWLMDDKEKQFHSSKKALTMMLNLKEYVGDPRYHIMLGVIYALLEKNGLAIKEAKIALALAPQSKDAHKVTLYEGLFAEVYTFLGEYDKALDIMEKLLSGPSTFSWEDIKYHHVFHKVYKNNSRFKRIVKKDEERFRREATYDLSIYLP